MRRTGEDRAKALLKRRFGQDAYWIEPGIGSTFGLPDCFIHIGGGIVVFIECKEAISNADFSYKLRPSQAKVLPRMRRDGMHVCVMVGKPEVYDHFVFDDMQGTEWHVFKLDERERIEEVLAMIVEVQNG